MGVNRFMSPVKTQYMQTAVDQHVPMPFELMQKRAEAEQKHHDANEANMQALLGAMGENMLTVDDPVQREVIDALKHGFQDQMSMYKGDYRKADEDIRNLSNAWNTYIKTGEGAKGVQNKLTRDAGVKAINETKGSGEQKALSQQFADWNYDQGGRLAGGAEYQMPPLLEVNPGLAKDVQAAMNGLKADSTSNPFTVMLEGGNVRYTGSSTMTGKTKEAYMNAIKRAVDQDPYWNDTTLAEYRMMEKMGTLPEGVTNYDSYHKQRLENQFLQHVDGYKQEKITGSGSLTGQGKSRDETSLGFVTSGSGTTYTSPIAGIDEWNGKDGAKLIDADIKSKGVSFVDHAFDHLQLSSDLNPAQASDKISRNLAAAGFELDPNNNEDRQLITEGVATGAISISMLGYQPGSPAAVKAMGEVRGYQIAKANQRAVHQDVLSDMASKQEISPERYALLSDHLDKTYTSIDSYNQARLRGAPKEELDRLKADIQSISAEIEDQEEAGIINTYFGFNSHGALGYSQMDDRTNDERKLSKELNIFNDYLDNRLTHNKNSKTKVTYGDSPVATGNPAADKNINKDIQRAVKANLGTFLRQTITTPDHTEGKTVEFLIREQIRQNLSPEVKSDAKAMQDTIDTRYKEQIAGMKTGSIPFSSVFNDRDEIIMKLGDFNVPLSFEESQIMIDGKTLKESLGAKTINDMRLKTLRVKLKSSPANSLSLGDGVTLTAGDPSAKSQGGDVTRDVPLVITLDNQKFGLSQDVPKTVIPTELVSDYMRMDGQLNRLGETDEYRKEVTQAWLKKNGI